MDHSVVGTTDQVPPAVFIPVMEFGSGPGPNVNHIRGKAGGFQVCASIKNGIILATIIQVDQNFALGTTHQQIWSGIVVPEYQSREKPQASRSRQGKIFAIGLGEKTGGKDRLGKGARIEEYFHLGGSGTASALAHDEVRKLVVIPIGKLGHRIPRNLQIRAVCLNQILFQVNVTGSGNVRGQEKDYQTGKTEFDSGVGNRHGTGPLD